MRETSFNGSFND